MATGNAVKAIRAPGRLVVNPTQAFDGGTYPYGGTEVGRTNACIVQPLGVSFRIVAEGLGEATDILEANNQIVFTCFLRGWDDDAVRLFLAGGYTAGTVTQHAVWDMPGARTPGQSTLSRAVILAFIPDDPIHTPGILIYNGIADWDENAEVAFQRGEELGIPLRVDCLRDGNSNIIKIGRLPDLSLT